MALAKALETNESLESLILFVNSMGPEVAAAIARALERNQTLKHLTLFHSNIGPEGAAAISMALERNHTLTELRLGWDNIGPEGAVTISVALETRLLAFIYALIYRYRRHRMGPFCFAAGQWVFVDTGGV